jgi:hypothetical protein
LNWDKHFPISQLVAKNKYITIKIKIMGNLLYIIAVILIIGWAIGFIGYSACGLINVLLVIAVIAIIVKLLQGRF